MSDAASCLVMSAARAPLFQRESGPGSGILYRDAHGYHRLRPLAEVCPDVDGLIRVRDPDVRWIPRAPGAIFAVANLQDGQHVPGLIYGMPRILRHGWFISPDREQLPLLDVTDMARARCIAHRAYDHYSSVAATDVAMLFPPIRSHGGLRDAIVSRYSESLPSLRVDEIVRLGVSITVLETLVS